jgi:hypothetical protein
MVKYQFASLGLLIATVLAGQAAFWFVSGGYAGHPVSRSALVGVQLAISVAAAVGFVNRLRRQS